MKTQKVKSWDLMSVVEQSFLAASYKRYIDSISKVSGPEKTDSFQRWLSKRGIRYNLHPGH